MAVKRAAKRSVKRLSLRRALALFDYSREFMRECGWSAGQAGILAMVQPGEVFFIKEGVRIIGGVMVAISTKGGSRGVLLSNELLFKREEFRKHRKG